MSSPYLDLRNPDMVDCGAMELFHVLNRGVDKRDIFMDDTDYARFVHDLFEFNDTKKAGSTYHSFSKHILGLRNPDMGAAPRERLVDIHGWCLMKNHYHLLISERREGGLAQFVRKMNVGYANYFNERHKRSGTLFQGRTKKVSVSSLPHELHILHYLHLNPLDYRASTRDWRSKRIQNASSALAYLDQYKWSSYQDYTGIQNFPSILTTDFFRDIHGDIKKKTAEYLKDIDVSTIQPLTLE